MKGQSLADLKAVLSTNKLGNLNEYMARKDSRRLKICHWHALREIAPGYSEGMASFDFYIPPLQRDSLENNYITYRLSILTAGDSIFYYKVEEKTIIRQDTNAKIGYKTISVFGEKNIADLDSSFYKTFHAPLNEDELFIDTISYGDYCGYAATITPERRIINLFVEQNNDKELLRWLTSTNTEKQVYAIDGLLQLKKKGYKINDQTWDLMRYIIGKTGTIQTCAGCIYGAFEIGDVIKL